MNITQEVVTDLLPIYFSGEASRDTKVLVEEYFRENPDFERMARSAGTLLETLRVAPPVAAGSEKEKRDLESVRCGLDRRKWLFGLSLFLTLSPLSFYFTHGHLVAGRLPALHGVKQTTLCQQDVLGGFADGPAVLPRLPVPLRFAHVLHIGDILFLRILQQFDKMRSLFSGPLNGSSENRTGSVLHSIALFRLFL